MSEYVQRIAGEENSDGYTAVSQLPPQWLPVARVGWVVLALAAVAVLITSLPGYALKMQGQFSHAASENMPTDHLLFSALGGLASLVAALLSLTLSWMFFRRRFEETAVTVLSFYLLVYGVVMAGPLEMWSAYWIENLGLATVLQAVLLAFPSVALFVLFPNGRFVPSWTRWLLLLAVPWSISLSFLPLYDGASIAGLPVVSGALMVLWTVSFFFAGVVAQIYRYRHVSTPIEQQQTKWIIYGFGLWLGYVFLSTGPYFYLTGLPPDAPVPWWAAASEFGWFLSLNIIPVSLSIALTRHRLWDIDLIINRTLVYGVLTAVGIILYLLVVVSMGMMFQQSSDVVNVLLTAVLLLILFKPLRSFLQQGVDRVVSVKGKRPSTKPTSPIIPVAKKEVQIAEPASFQLTSSWLRLTHFVWLILALTVTALTIWARGILRPISLADVPFGLIMPLGFFVIAIIIFWRKPNDGMAILTSLMLIFLGPYLISGVNEIIELQIGWTWLNRFLLGMGFSTFILFLLLFPNGRFVPKWIRPLTFLVIASNFIALLLSVQVYTNFSVTLIIISTIVGILTQFYRYRYVSNGMQRQQTKWIVVGYTGPLLVVSWWFLIVVPGIYPLPTEPINYFLHQLAFASLALWLPLSFAFSILRYRLWDIDVIINRTLVYGALTACVVAVYALVVGAMGTLLQAQGNWLIALVATGLVAVLFQPLRERWQQWVNQLLYGRRDEPFEVLASLGQRLEATISPETVYPTIVETVAQTLKLPYVALTVKKGESQQTVESFGKPIAAPESFPLTYQGVAIGQLLAARRSPDEPFTEGEERLLRNIARQAGTAVHAHQLTDDLQQARQQIISSREEERRRLRRDLHDGLGPTLASHMLKIGSARALLTDRPQLTDKLLSEMETDIENTLAELRRIVYELRPPALDQWGLVGALRAYAETCENGEHPTLTIRVDTPNRLPPLPAAVEVAAYHIGREGLTNVVRHAQANQCALKLRVDEGENDLHAFTGASCLHLIIQDDGHGFGKESPAGVGLTSMHERAAELGGLCTIESKVGEGTQITAVLPFGDQDPRSSTS